MDSETKLSKLGRRIEERRVQLGLTKDAVQRGAKISPNTYYRLLEGEIGQTSLRTFQQIADALKMPLPELLGGEIIPKPEDEVKDRLDEITRLLKQRQAPTGEAAAKLLRVPVWGRVAAGLGAENEVLTEEPETHIEIPERIMTLPGRKMGYVVSGDSMEPQLYEGDILVVWYGTQADVRERSRQGDIMAVTDNYNDEFVKRCYWNDRDGRLTLRSLNPAYEDIELDYAAIRWTGLVVMTVRGDL
ncbi:helix-turn-helix domain-containing protein [bacterium]|nr:helix-turn-helix domain-containing protein [bacterium]